MAEQAKLPEKAPEKKEIEKPKLGPVLIGLEAARQAMMTDFVSDFKFFSRKVQEGLVKGEEPMSDEHVVSLFHEYLDLKVSEFIAVKDIEVAMLRQKVAEATPASDAQKAALKKLRDFYPELKNEFKVALEKAGLKSLTDEDMNKITLDQASTMMSYLVPFRNKLGYRDSLPKGNFHTADELLDPGNEGPPY